jgi:uncharacterized membrane protein YobD (UPF0266 family)
MFFSGEGHIISPSFSSLEMMICQVVMYVYIHFILFPMKLFVNSSFLFAKAACHEGWMEVKLSAVLIAEEDGG